MQAHTHTRVRASLITQNAHTTKIAYLFQCSAVFSAHSATRKEMGSEVSTEGTISTVMTQTPVNEMYGPFPNRDLVFAAVTQS